MTEVTLRHCRKCDEDKSTTEYYVSSTRNDQLSAYCRDCTKSARLKRYHDNKVPGDQRERSLKHRYGITLADFDAMMDAQNGACVCGNDYPGRTLYVDHDHNSGRVRGLLCARCNQLVGALDALLADPGLYVRLLAHVGAE